MKKLTVWYSVWDHATKKDLLLRGYPPSRMGFLYSCAKCEGRVAVTYKDLDGKDTQSTTLVANLLGGYTKMYTTHLVCLSCGHGGRILDND
jgi:hypothetical protein